MSRFSGSRHVWAVVLLTAAFTLGICAVAATRPVVRASHRYIPRQQGELTAADSAEADSFGSSVAITGDTALVGSPQHSVSGFSGAGAAYVYSHTGDGWTQLVRLAADDSAAWDGFGAAVAISGDTALVGAPGRSAGAGEDAGAAYVYTRTNGVWTQQARLVASDAAALDDFGASVAVDGDTVVIGAPYHAVAGRVEAGAAYVFTRTGASWSQQAELTAADAGAGDWLGTSVAADGDTVVAGASGRAAGAAYVFTRSSAGWTQQAALEAPDAVNGDSFGTAVALQADTAAVGSPGHDAPAAGGAGAAYIFVRNGAAWGPAAELAEPSPAAGDMFGTSVALSASTALVGAAGRDTFALQDAGAAYTFARADGTWSHEGELTATDAAAGDQLGGSVGLSGRTAVAGADGHAVGGLEAAGAAYIFALDALPVPPNIVSFAPASARVGKSVTLIGEGFTGATSVGFAGSAKAKFRVLSDARITTTVPAAAKTGRITVTTRLGSARTAKSFVVLRLAVIKKLRPTSCRRGAVVTLTGKWFGAKHGKSSVRFGSKKVRKVVSWSDKRIRCRVPRTAKVGRIAVRIRTAAGTSKVKYLRVKR